MSVTLRGPHVADGRARCRAGGFTLVEVLVAVIVLSVGLLGVGKMVLFAARANGSAYMRSEATQQAYAMLDYMHANRAAALAGAYNVAIGANPPAAQDCFAAGPCTTPAAIASYDLAQWKAQLAAVLPAGDGSVTIATDAANTQTLVTVTVQWDDNGAVSTFNPAGVGTPASIVLESQL